MSSIKQSRCALSSLAEALAQQQQEPAPAAPTPTPTPTPALEEWFAGLPDDRARALLRRTLEVDAPLIATSFASLGSCLYARALAEPSLATLVAEWARELDGHDAPWVRALRPTPLPPGLVARCARQALSPDQPAPRRIELPSGAVLEVSAADETRVSWSWRLPDPDPVKRISKYARPRYKKNGWGPTKMIRSGQLEAIELPCPERGTADAKLSADGATLFVYGSHDDYDGGFAMLLDPESLEILTSVETERPVSNISECARPDRLLLNTYGSPVLWTAGELHALPLPKGDYALSSDGCYLAAGLTEVSVWLVDELLTSEEQPSEPGLPTVFDPTGERLVSHRTLYHGRTSEVIAQLGTSLGGYLMGGPPTRSFLCTERFLFNLDSRMQMWSTTTGEALRDTSAQPGDSDRTEPCWIGKLHCGLDSLACDAAGTILATHKRPSSSVALSSLPLDQTFSLLHFQISGLSMAADRDATRIALADGTTVEVRTRTGDLVATMPWPPDMIKEVSWSDSPHLLFSRDGAQIACSWDEQHWALWPLAGEPKSAERFEGDLPKLHPAFAEPTHADWQVEGSSFSVFTHLPTRTQVAFPSISSWRYHPIDPRIAASPDAHVELRWTASIEPPTDDAVR